MAGRAARHRLAQPTPTGRPSRPDAQADLTVAPNAHRIEQILQQRMADRTAGELDHVVRATTAKPETTMATHGEAERRAVRPCRHGGSDSHDRVGDPASSLQGFDDDLGLQPQLRSGRNVLPRATTAPGGVGRARRLDAVGRGFDSCHHLGAHVVLLGLDDLNLHQFAGKGVTDERDTTIGQSGNRVTTGGHLLDSHDSGRHRCRL